jgi:hypothetical protein
VLILGAVALYFLYETIRNFLMEIISQYRTLKRECENGDRKKETS